ncbi:MFS transporter [Citricoccus sp. K5]|uniref:MFS transporter n=1 Tax=Citricoccus sp. K5 TaxID=2653135 RepID=UPI0012F187BF|nr:MFS transporter [Citricoccus sp. K5]VXB54015.1 Major Facilitator Superfamily protein [Citricoccus sp. K5]
MKAALRRRQGGALLFGGLASVVGFLAFVEFTSGVLQGYYAPLLTDIARHLGVNDADVNWLEGSQLMLSALVVPMLSKLGDQVGHRKVLIWSTAVTLAASIALVVAPVFWVFLVAWAFQGFYVVWLPLEIALVYVRTVAREDAAAAASGPAALTRRAAAVLVGALEVGAIAGALAAGALVDTMDVQAVLAVPAVVVGLCLVAIILGVEETPGASLANFRRRDFDMAGLFWVTVALVLIMGSLFVLRGAGLAPDRPGFWLSVLMLVAGALALVRFVRIERQHPDPLIDIRMFTDPALWPVFATAGLFGVSVLGAQAPLSTFARTDPGIYGYGLGTTGFQTSLIIGTYLIAMVAGAGLLPVASRWTSPRLALLCATLCVAVGFGLFLPFHDQIGQVVANMVVVGLGSGALVASLPAAAAAAAPREQTGVATGLTNSVKTVGGAVASCIFGLALATTAAAGIPGPEVVPEITGTPDVGTAGSFSGYLTVWIVCSATALAAAVLLLFVPKKAFQ